MSDPMTLIFWLAFVGLAATTGGLGALLHHERDRLHRSNRLARANGTARGGAGADLPQNGQSGFALIGKSMRDAILRLGERLAALLGGEARETAAQLASAGFRGRDALLVFAFLKTVLPLLALLAGLVWVWVSYPVGLGMIIPLAVAIVISLGLSMGVDMVLNLRRRARMDAIRRAFPDMLELLVISSEAGLGPQPALERVALEMAVSQPELAWEILQMVAEMRMTNARRAAYDKLNARVPLPEIGTFTQTLDQSDTYGTPFSKAMRTLITEQRANRLMFIEEKAARLPVLMTMPLIFCVMPAVFIVLIGPAVLSVIDNIFSGG
ncbi:MAG: type II secretion system F family protein [Sulfitobacter sp.]|nr:type II secretion system F family protein [Sulfitobacter sp.]